jgi:hypothetical protein
MEGKAAEALGLLQKAVAEGAHPSVIEQRKVAHATAVSAARLPLAMPLEDDILVFHYVLEGPEGTPYAGGHYHGYLKFTSEYPLKPPAVLMLTPSGRFEVNQRICLSMSDYHVSKTTPRVAFSPAFSPCACSSLTALTPFTPPTHPPTHPSFSPCFATPCCVARVMAANLEPRQNPHGPAVLHD